MFSAQKEQTLMARQPIVNDKKETIAYELLYRSSTSENQDVFGFSGSIATIHVLLNSFTSIYKKNKITQMPAFINLTASLLINGTLPELPANRVVLEILEDVEVTQELIDAIKDLHLKGYRIALDDFVYDDKYIPLLKLAKIVKIDVLNISFEQISEQVAKLKPYGLVLLAEKVETHEMFEFCKSLGFKFFQGYFLSKPEIIEGIKVEPSTIHLLKIIIELEKPEVKASKLAALILQDPVFTFKMLRIVNSSANQLVRKIHSIEEVINLLGITEIKKWVLISVMMSSPDKSDEIIRQLLVRGRMCEQIAIANDKNSSASYMIAGILSGLDAILDIEMEDVLAQVPLSHEIKSAISKGQGDIGKVLYNIISFSKGEWAEISLDIDATIYHDAYLESVKWANDTLKAMD